IHQRHGGGRDGRGHAPADCSLRSLVRKLRQGTAPRCQVIMIRSQQLPAAWRMDEADSKPAGNSKFRRLFLTRQIRAGARTIGFSALTFFSVGCLPAMAEPNGLTVELNKLESQGSGCRAYMVVQNDSDTSYKAFKLDLVLFQSDGVIGRRFAMDLAPLKA